MGKEYKYKVATRCFTFNQARYVVDSMNGFSMQETSFPVVTIIVDDASTDGEPEVIRKYLSEHFHSPFRTEETNDYLLICANHRINPNCTFVVFLLKYNHYSIKKPKKNYFSKWLENAEYQALCEGDDYWTNPHKLQKQVELLENDKQVGMVHTDCAAFIQDKAQTKHNINRTDSANTIVDTSDWENGIKAYYAGKLVIRYCTVLFRSALISEIQKADPFLFDSHLRLGDTQMWIGVLLQKKRIAYLDEETAVYRILKGSASHEISYIKQLAFAISRYEIRVYYKRKYGILKDAPNIERKYYNYVRIYRLLYDPRYKDIDGNTAEGNIVLRLLSRCKLFRGILYRIIDLKNKIRS